MNSYRTEIFPDKSHNKITFNDGLLFLGSCFSDNIGQRFSQLKFNATINPFGVLFNPVSIADAMLLAMDEKPFSESDLVQHNELWSSFYHHSSFSSTNQKQTYSKALQSIDRLKDSLKQSNWLFITFGSAWVYHHFEKNMVVANCHKIPSSNFQKQMLSVGEVVELYSNLISLLKQINPSLNIVFTVSPVRHWKDGVVENQRSKAVLHLAIDELEKQFEYVSYFPAYELIMDDLRDYRFYSEDMLHPNNQAINYVWEKLSQTYFDELTIKSIQKIEQLIKASTHKPFNVKTAAHQQFLKNQLNALNSIENELKLSLTDLRISFESQLI